MPIRLAADLSACFDLFRFSAVRVETLRVYDVPAEAGLLEAFREGLPLPERSARTNPWLARIHRTSTRGKSWQRIRVLDRPLTDYQRFQVSYGYPPSVMAGEVILVAERNPELLAVIGDFWLFDDPEDPFAAMMHYDQDGAYLGSEVTADPAVIARCRNHERLAAQHAVPLQAFLAADMT